MKRRNFLLNFLFWILSFIFGYRVGNSDTKSGVSSEELAKTQKHTTDWVNVKTFKCDDGQYVKGNANYYNEADNKFYEDEAFTIEAHDDTSGIQKAIELVKERGGVVYFPTGGYLCNLTIYNRMTLKGAGTSSTMLISVPNSNKDVIRSYDFENQSQNLSSVPNGCNQTVIEDISINGNKDNNTLGYGIRIFGVGHSWKNVHVINCAESGIYTKGDSYYDGDSWIYNTVIKEPECFFYNIKSALNNKNGWEYHGPHDSLLVSIHLMRNNEWGMKNYTEHKSIYMNCFKNVKGGIYSESGFSCSMIQMNSEYGLLNDDLGGNNEDYGIYCAKSGVRIFNGFIDSYAKAIYVKEVGGNFTIDNLMISRCILGVEGDSINQIYGNINFLSTKYGFKIAKETHNSLITINGSFNETTSFLHYPGSSFGVESHIIYNSIVPHNSFEQVNGRKNIKRFDWRKPIAGTYTKGDIVYNTNPSSGSYVGWVCIKEGDANERAEFKGFGLIE